LPAATNALTLTGSFYQTSTKPLPLHRRLETRMARAFIARKGKRHWVVVETDRDPLTNKRQRKWHSSYRTKRDAESVRIKILADLMAGSYVAPDKSTIKTFLEDEWLPAIAHTIRPNTLEHYRTQTAAYVVPRLGNVQLQSLTPQRLNTFYGELLAKGATNGAPLAPQTVRNVHRMIHTALEAAVRWGKLSRNAASAAQPPRLPKADRRIWTEDDLRVFLEFASDDPLFALWLLAATTGMRRSELLGLQWCDLHLDDGYLTIVRALTVAAHRIHLDAPKTAHGSRRVGLDAMTVEVLRQHRRSEQERSLAEGRSWDTSAPVFSTAAGEPIHPEALTKRFTKLVRASGLPSIRLHDLRHSYATLALLTGVDPKLVSSRLGHGTLSVTSDLYTHALPSHDQQVANVLAEKIFPRRADPAEGHAT
jgi:integrase